MRREFIRRDRVGYALNRFLSERAGLDRGFEVVDLTWRGQGLFYTVFAFALRRAGAHDGVYVVRILNPEVKDKEAATRLARSCRLLQALDDDALAPRCIGFDEIGEHMGRPFAVESFVAGVTLSEVPKDPARWLPVAARELARVHSVPVTPEMAALFPPATRFAEDELARVRREVESAGKEVGVLASALDVAARVLPPSTAPHLLHGDPLLQNLILRLDFEGHAESFVWIDWEFARLGDPAYDLSIFTRGRFGTLYGLKNGRRTYLDAYRSSAGREIAERDVLFYELLLFSSSVCSLIEERRDGEVDQYARLIERLIRKLPET